MLASNRPPALGGETRTITAFFADVAGFSKLSESRTPSEIVALMNEYLTAMTDIVEEHGGFVDKYVGDAIAAVFGAPLDDERHASSAVRAALACRRRLAELDRAGAAFGSHKLDHRIGLNSGEALVGNIGSRRRFNYTVMGDMVNVASRLEGANKYFGTSIIASEATVALTGGAFVWRELELSCPGPIATREDFRTARRERAGERRRRGARERLRGRPCALASARLRGRSRML